MDSVNSKLFWLQFSLFLLFAFLLLAPLESFAQTGWTIERDGNFCPNISASSNSDEGEHTVRVSVPESPQRYAEVRLFDTEPSLNSIQLSWKGDIQTEMSYGELGENDFATGALLTPVANTSAVDGKFDLQGQERFSVLLDRLHGDGEMDLPFAAPAGIISRDTNASHVIFIMPQERRIICGPIHAGIATFSFNANVVLMAGAAELVVEEYFLIKEQEQLISNLEGQLFASQQSSAGLQAQVTECSNQNGELSTQLTGALEQNTQYLQQITSLEENETQCVNAYGVLNGKLNSEQGNRLQCEANFDRSIDALNICTRALKTVRKNGKRIARTDQTAGRSYFAGQTKFLKQETDKIKSALKK